MFFFQLFCIFWVLVNISADFSLSENEVKNCYIDIPSNAEGELSICANRRVYLDYIYICLEGKLKTGHPLKFELRSNCYSSSKHIKQASLMLKLYSNLPECAPSCYRDTMNGIMNQKAAHDNWLLNWIQNKELIRLHHNIQATIPVIRSFTHTSTVAIKKSSETWKIDRGDDSERKIVVKRESHESTSTSHSVVTGLSPGLKSEGQIKWRLHSLPTDTVKSIIPQYKTIQDSKGPVGDYHNGIILKGVNHGEMHDQIQLWYITNIEESMMSHEGGVCFRNISLISVYPDRKNHVRYTGLYFNAIICMFDENSKYLDIHIKFHGLPDKKSSFHISREYDEGSCSNNNNYYKKTWILSKRPTDYQKSYLICSNGSITDIGSSELSHVASCTTIFYAEKTTQCKKMDNFQCTIEDPQISKEGSVIARIKSNSKPEVIFVSDLETTKMKCNYLCVITGKAKVHFEVRCGDEFIKRELSHEIEVNCPLVSIWLISNVASTICKMTFRPTVFYVFILWLAVGKIATAAGLFLMGFLITLFWKLIAKIKIRRNKTLEVCEFCEDNIDYSEFLEYHESCLANICPYCRSSQSNPDNLKSHVKTCMSKGGHVRNFLRARLEKSSFKRIFKKVFKVTKNHNLRWIVYLIILLNLATFIVLPVKALEDVNFEYDKKFNSDSEDTSPLEKKHLDRFDYVDRGLIECGLDCFKHQGRCECPEENPQRNKREAEDQQGHIRSSRTREIGRDFPEPRGFFSPKEAFSPFESKSVISLEITDKKTLKDEIIITGESVAEMPLEVGTCITWKISHDESFESKHITLSLYDYEQVYAMNHLKWILDRKLKLSSEVTCTKHCSNNCGCSDKSCYYKKYEHDRGWGCNPSWCWAMGTGCTCCFVFASLDDSHYIWAHEEVKLEDTKLILCINEVEGKFNCRVVRGFETFTINNYEFQIGSIYNQKLLLPKNIVLSYNSKQGGKDLSDPDDIILNPEICDHSGCTHGQIGDTIIPGENLFNKRSDTLFFNEPSVIWKGVSLTRECHFSTNPICYADGIVENITGLFHKEIQDRELLKTNFILYNLHKGKITVRPKHRDGQINIFMKARGVELQKKEVKIEVLTFRINSCTGCRSCRKGFTCDLTVTLKKPDRAIIHISSTTESVVSGLKSLRATTSPHNFNVSFFTAMKLSTLELIIEETETKASTNKIKLLEPTIEVIEKMTSIYHQTDMNEDQSTFSIIGNNVLSLGRGVWNVISLFFLDWKLSVLLVLFIVAIIIFCNCGLVGRLVRRKIKINASKLTKKAVAKQTTLPLRNNSRDADSEMLKLD